MRKQTGPPAHTAVCVKLKKTRYVWGFFSCDCPGRRVPFDRNTPKPRQRREEILLGHMTPRHENHDLRPAKRRGRSPTIPDNPDRGTQVHGGDMQCQAYLREHVGGGRAVQLVQHRGQLSSPVNEREGHNVWHCPSKHRNQMTPSLLSIVSKKKYTHIPGSPSPSRIHGLHSKPPLTLLPTSFPSRGLRCPSLPRQRFR